MATSRKLTPQTPGEPVQDPAIAEQTAPEAEQTASIAEQKPEVAGDHAPADDANAAADPQPSTTETAATAPAAIERRPGELPDASEIDPKSITKPVLTKQGYVVPEK